MSGSDRNSLLKARRTLIASLVLWLGANCTLLVLRLVGVLSSRSLYVSHQSLEPSTIAARR